MKFYLRVGREAGKLKKKPCIKFKGVEQPVGGGGGGGGGREG